jgi:hypothetical protein
MPVLYCGILIYYFLDISGSLRGAKTIGLTPTLLGLGVVGLLFCIPLIVTLMRMFSGPRSPESGPNASGDDNGFDADAAVARYMAQQPAKGTSAAPSYGRGGPVKRSSFGRRSG